MLNNKCDHGSITINDNKDVEMKSVLLSLSFVFTILSTMVSCQSQSSRSFATHEDIRNEVVFRNDMRLEREVARIVDTASKTQGVQFVQPNFN